MQESGDEVVDGEMVAMKFFLEPSMVWSYSSDDDARIEAFISRKMLLQLHLADRSSAQTAKQGILQTDDGRFQLMRASGNWEHQLRFCMRSGLLQLAVAFLQEVTVC